jgi:putative redox protein
MVTHAEWQTGFECKTEALESGDVLIGDEPEELGGKNQGPNPFALLQMSLANCTIVTVKGEADLLGVELDGLTVDVKHKQNKLVGGPADPEQRTLKMTQLRRSINVRGGLSPEQVDRLLWAAENCPVSTTLAEGVEIKTEIEHSA